MACSGLSTPPDLRSWEFETKEKKKRIKSKKFLMGNILRKLPDYFKTFKLFEVQFFNYHIIHSCFRRTLLAPGNKFLKQLFSCRCSYFNISIGEIFDPAFNT